MTKIALVVATLAFLIATAAAFDVSTSYNTIELRQPTNPPECTTFKPGGKNVKNVCNGGVLARSCESGHTCLNLVFYHPAENTYTVNNFLLDICQPTGGIPMFGNYSIFRKAGNVVNAIECKQAGCSGECKVVAPYALGCTGRGDTVCHSVKPCSAVQIEQYRHSFCHGSSSTVYGPANVCATDYEYVCS